MRVIAVTNMYPTPEAPALGSHVEQQIKGLIQIGLNVHVIVINRVQRGMHGYLGFGRLVREKVMDFQPDLVHVMYGGIMADIVTRTIQDRPTVVSFCGSDLLGENLSGAVRKFISTYGIYASHRAAKRASGIVVKSKNLHDALPVDVDPKKVRIIPNGVDIQLFKPLDRGECRAQLGWHADRFHVVFPTNSGDPCKRFYLAEAAVDIISRLGFDIEIHQLRGIPHRDVPMWLNASDLVLLTSLHEGSPNIVKEALACDIPVVSVDVGDVRERLRGIDGCYIALPEAADLALKVQMVITGSHRVAGRHAMEELSLNRIALRHKQLYDEVTRWQQRRLVG
jgi:glycosyltransferase involved in cell wall biosynthesis